METFKIKISPEFLSTDIISQTFSGETFGVYSAMTSLVKAGIGGTSFFTGLTIPITLKQEYHDIGYYSLFDGEISQLNVTTNFIFSATSASPCTYYVYNTSESNINYLQNSTYVIDWGDGVTDVLTNYSPNSINHTYGACDVNNPSEYIITMIQTNSWGVVQVQNTITVPYSDVVISNPYGTVNFVTQGGSWNGTPTSYNYYWTGDTTTNVVDQISPSYVSVPFTISGNSQSRIEELRLYGSNPFQVNVPVNIPNCSGCTGMITFISDELTAYTINNISYIDYSNSQTIYIAQSSGLTESMLTFSAITKNEVLMNLIDDIQIQSTVLVARGLNSGLENFRRIGEVRTTPGLVKYGYGYFNVVESF